jgi:hypothetical protein
MRVKPGCIGEDGVRQVRLVGDRYPGQQALQHFGAKNLSVADSLNDHLQPLKL